VQSPRGWHKALQISRVSPGLAVPENIFISLGISI
jgi:hypothetical protein